MHGVLFYLLKEFINFKDPLAEKYDLSPHLETCEKNFSAGIETYEILVVPNFENTLSLLLAVSGLDRRAKAKRHFKSKVNWLTFCDNSRLSRRKMKRTCCCPRPLFQWHLDTVSCLAITVLSHTKIKKPTWRRIFADCFGLCISSIKICHYSLDGRLAYRTTILIFPTQPVLTTRQ